MRLDLRLRTFRSIVQNYRFDEPLSRFLGTFYRANKQMGSRDRRMASRIVFTFYRLGKALSNLLIEERLAVAFFLCDTNADDFNQELIKQYTSLNTALLGASIDDKLKAIQQQYPSFILSDVFPYTAVLSDGIDKEAYTKGFFTQPKLWIRVRKGFLPKVLDELNVKSIPFEADAEMPNCIGFENGTSLDGLIAQEKGWFEVQDRSSQRVARYFELAQNQRWWDCCAGSGGKALLLADLEPSLKLTLSDVRPTIIKNLENRLKRVGVVPERTFCGDITNSHVLKSIDLKLFDGIVTDVPCSGSGTWARTPEMLCGFDAQKLAHFNSLQQAILDNVVFYLKTGESLVYITCSVFKQENEGILTFLQQEKKLKLVVSEVLQSTGADYMFVARLLKV